MIRGYYVNNMNERDYNRYYLYSEEQSRWIHFIFDDNARLIYSSTGIDSTGVSLCALEDGRIFTKIDPKAILSMMGVI